MRIDEVASLVDDAVDLIDLAIAPQSNIAAPTTDPRSAMIKGALTKLRRAAQLLEAADA